MEELSLLVLLCVSDLRRVAIFGERARTSFDLSQSTVMGLGGFPDESVMRIQRRGG
jgi:hypothetical protein